MRTIGSGLAGALLLGSVLCLASGDAGACGGFFSRVETKRRPSLSYEQTLIVYDSVQRREHFIREVTFRAAGERFGFVVPTPGRPEVAKLKSSPFEQLARNFPYENVFGLGGLGTIGHGSGQGFGSGRGSVKVLEVKKVGSFTAFVLAADDQKALSDWLKKNGLSSTKQSDAWLAHYVKMKFFYVAMRYDPPAGKNQIPSTKAETIAISFDTPLAYYPYFEPEPSPGQDVSGKRMLELWYASRERAQPVALHERAGKRQWVRPCAEGRYYPKAETTLRDALAQEAKYVFSGELNVQRFIDQKRSRTGFSDVLFVPERSRDPDEKREQQLAGLLPVLDPSLLEAP